MPCQERFIWVLARRGSSRVGRLTALVIRRAPVSPSRFFQSSARRGAAMVVVAVLGGLGIGYVLVPKSETPSVEKEPPPEVRLLGTPLPLGDDAPQRDRREHVP